jgi:hypothetical protein
MVYRHLPDYREEHTNPLDVAGLILFGFGVALLSYVLEVFGEHTLNGREIIGALAVSFLLLAGYGFHATRTLTSLQYTSMNTLVFAGATQEQESSASSIASTMQQMAISFGVASASLVTGFFLPNRYRSSPQQFIHGIHWAFFVLGGVTILSTIVFCELRRGDGDAVSQGEASTRWVEGGWARGAARDPSEQEASLSTELRRTALLRIVVLPNVFCPTTAVCVQRFRLFEQC